MASDRHAPSVAEIDEALTHANAIPLDERGAIWQAFVDRLLDQRAAQAKV
jgi:hypothetical protein